MRGVNQKAFLASAVLSLPFLLSTAFAAEPLSVKVEGVFRYDIANVHEDDDGDLRKIDARTSTEIHIKAKGILDDGLEYGATVEIETDRSPLDNGDDNLIYIQDNWGRLQFGDRDGVAESDDGISITAPRGFGEGGVVADSESYRDFITNRRSVLSPTDNAFRDLNFLATLYESPNPGSATKITYYSPKINGWQIGLSYAPDFVDGGNTTTRADEADNNDNYENDVNNILETAIRYETDIDEDWKIKTSFVYVHSDADKDPTSNTEFIEPIRSWTAGVEINYQGFTLAGSWTDAGKTFADKDAVAAGHFDDSQAFTVGALYKWNQYAVGVNHISSSAEGRSAAVSAKDTTYDATSVGVSYFPVSGVQIFTELTAFELEGDNDAVTTDDNSGHVLMMGTRIAF